jgi:sRNA-binding carbon storage regulator CsrA
MMVWKRKVGDSLVLGDDTVISVAQVSMADGSKFQGTISLGFEVPPGVLVQRAETYVKQNERPPFPQFYRYVNKETNSVFGYSFTAQSEPSTLETGGYRCELVSDYDDMRKDDRLLEIYLFRSEVEAEACVIGITAVGDVGNYTGVVKYLHGNLWAVMIDHFDQYQEDPDTPNPIIRSYAEPSARVMAAIEGKPQRKTA